MSSREPEETAELVLQALYQSGQRGIVFSGWADPQPIPRRKLTANRLAQAIERAMDDQLLRLRAAELGRKIKAENGIGAAVVFISGILLEKEDQHSIFNV